MGILEFVFGKGEPKNDTQTKQAYYLNDDDAKTFGNINYMRSSKTVRRTFAKKKGKEHLESIRQISALKAAAANNDGLFSPLAQDVANANGAQPSVSPDMGVPKSERPRRKPGSNDMDMFRNMAKDIRK
ncbi:hypothetical protein [Leptolyngbya sp. BC1307]|uniref:hypothetical protein n=1 Tax=Leptolyngbya sp. BC1307 TaxID=2029589 RepID=UPI000EFD5242|nr:hypothetical protein [Leptolyngbya sp. BC1307]